MPPYSGKQTVLLLMFSKRSMDEPDLTTAKIVVRFL